MPDINYERLAEAMLAKLTGSRYKEVSSTPSGVMAHGRGGLFSALGLDQQLFSAMQLPQHGLASVLPVLPTVYTDPLFGIITGVTATTGSDPAGPCSDFPVAGTMKLCTTSLPLGRYGRATTVIDIDEAGKRVNRGDFLDLRVGGDPFKSSDGAMVPTFPGGFGGLDGAARSELWKRLTELAVAFSRDFAYQVYEGNPANNNAGGGYKEFNGLNKLINTGYRDAVAGVACQAADSIVQSFNNLDVASNGAAIVRLISYIWRNLTKLDYETGLATVTRVITMPYSLFYEISEVWPCAYMSYRCNPSSGNTGFISAEEQIKMRDAMRGNLQARTGQYLLIDGQQVDVILDDAIREDGVGGGTQQSSIYFVPLTVLGGTRVTYFEYFDYNAKDGALDFARQMAPDGSYFTRDDGRFMWHVRPPNHFCVQAEVKTEPRIVMRTPFLAARITNVRYTPLLMPRSPFTDSSYFVNGGQTSYPAPSYYTPTA